jgi:hypothetical protein
MVPEVRIQRLLQEAMGARIGDHDAAKSAGQKETGQPVEQSVARQQTARIRENGGRQADHLQRRRGGGGAVQAESSRNKRRSREMGIQGVQRGEVLLAVRALARPSIE